MNNPWRGLASYKDPLYSKTAYMFCGRDTEIAEVTKYIDNNLFVTLYGRTGIGKTSLLNAGVFPLLRMRNYYPIYIRLSQKPKDYTYAQYVIEKIEGSDLKIRHAEIDNSALNNDSAFLLWNYFYTTKFYNGQDIEVYPVIVLDQFEEIFMMSKDESLLLLTQINTLLSDNYDVPEISGCSYETNYRFVASIREDNLYCLEDAIDELGLACLKENRYRLRPLSQANAKSVVLHPGCNCLRSEEADDIAEKAVELSKDNDGSVSSLILSLICSIMFESAKMQNHSAPTITAAMLPKNQRDTDEILCNFYLHHTTKKQRKVIEDELLTSDGHRKCSNVSIPNEEELLSNETRILQKQETSEGTQTEIVHDRMAKVIYMNRRKQDSHKFRNLLRFVIVFLLFCFLGIAIVMSWTSSNNSEHKPIIAVNTNRGNDDTIERTLIVNTECPKDSIKENSTIDSIFIGEKVINLDSLIIEKEDIKFGISPSNITFEVSMFWSSGSGEIKYIHKKDYPSEIVLSTKAYYGGYEYIRLPYGIDTLHFDDYRSYEHTAGLPRYGIKQAIICDTISPDIYKNDNCIEQITICDLDSFAYKFERNKNLKVVEFKTDSVNFNNICFASIFQYYSSDRLEEVHLPRKMSGLDVHFFICNMNLHTVSLPDVIDEKENIASMFQFCPNIKRFNISPNSNFHFSNDSILYYNEQPVYFNLCTRANWALEDSTYYSNNGLVYKKDGDCVSVNYQLRTKSYGWNESDQYFYKIGSPLTIVTFDKKISEISLPPHGTGKFILFGNLSSIKEIHSPTADPEAADIILINDWFYYKRNITLFVPYGCRERYALLDRFKEYYTIKEDPWYKRVFDTIEYYAYGATQVFNGSPLVYYGLTLLGLIVLFYIYYFLRRKQMKANGKFNSSQCIIAGISGIFTAIVSFVPIYYVIYVTLSNHVDNTNENVNEIIASVFGVMSSVICSYIFIFAGKGKIWNRWKDIIKRGL